jgi:heme-degrading monooxygenase HmoA
MYGTVARMRIKAGAEAKLIELSRAEESINIPGFVFQYVYRTDNDPRNYVLVIGFTDRDAYVKNANSPDQNTRYLAFRDLMERDPEWTDGEIVDMYMKQG